MNCGAPRLPPRTQLVARGFGLSTWARARNCSSSFGKYSPRGGYYGSCIGPGSGERVQFVLVGQEHELLEFVTKILAPGGIVESQRGQCIENAEFAGRAAI